LAVLLAFAMSLVPHGAGAAQKVPALAEAPEQSVAEPEPADDPAASPPEPPASHRSDLAVEDTRPKVQKMPQEEAEPPRSKSLRDTARTSAAERQMPSSPMQPMSLPTGENKTGVSAQSISVPKGPGTIEGMGESFSAQASTGIATFSVPIALPSARGDSQPSLALSYSSASGNGAAGIGWDIGVPFIARQTDRGLPSYDDEPSWHPQQDRFVYNGGQELVPVQALLPGEQLPVWATGGWQYFRPRIEGSYLRFFWSPSEQLWRVQDKSGVLLELGVVDGQRDALEHAPDDPNRVYRWNLKRSVDAHGNEVRYAYSQDGNLAYLRDVYSTSPVVISGPIVDSQWAHHVRLVYEPRPDVTFGFTRGWKATRALRLVRIDVTAKGMSAAEPRTLVRRYHTSYLAGLHASLLTSVQVEGRCAQPIAEGADGSLPSSACPRLPAMRLGYTHVATDAQGGPLLDGGFERLDTTVRTMSGSPDYSVDDTYTDLYDVNGDGLPDVVQTQAIPQLDWKHGLWLQGYQGKEDRFGPRQPMGVEGVGGVTASSLSKSSPVVAALDLDGNALIDLLHMPEDSTYSVYTPKGVGQNWNWTGRSITTSDGLDARIDLTNDASLIRVMDVNGDGLVDVVKSGESYQVWYALGRYPGGDGLFGTATWMANGTALLSMAPVERCVPWSSGSVSLGASDVKLADMNGDGLTDIVRVRSGDVRYWPGRGDGTFGTGPIGCPGGTHSENSYLLMDGSPAYTAPTGAMLQLADVNGDGTSDLVQIRTGEVDVWLNVDGTSWRPRKIVTATPSTSNYGKRVRLTDFNGSGTPDLVWGVGLDYRYIDLSAGKRPWLLSRVDNGLGKTTEVAYATSTQQMLEAERAGQPWQSTTPVVQHMVSRVAVRDNLSSVGRPEGIYGTEYRYRDPVFDGLQREFRGFRSTEVKVVGDANSPTSVTSTTFDLGERPASFPLDQAVVDYRTPAAAWRDNPREALKGLPLRSETYALSPSGTPDMHLSSQATGYRLRKLYEGLDGRAVYVAFAEQTDTLLYDTASFVAGSGSLSVAAVRVQDRDGAPVHDEVQVLPNRSPATSRRLRTRAVVDVWGNRTQQANDGEVGVDDVIVSHTEAQLVPTPGQWTGEGHWSFRTVGSWVQQGDDPSTRRQEARTFYDAFGDPVRTEVRIEGMVELDRSANGAPSPADRSTPGWKLASRTVYDDFGNAVLTTGPAGRCAQVGWDAPFAELAVTEVIYAGSSGLDVTVGPETFVCGLVPLGTSAVYDRGLGLATQVKDVNGAVTAVEYDGFGRTTALYGPRPDNPDEPSTTPSLVASYHLPDETLRPVSRLVVKTQDGATIDEPNYHETHALVDGLGRTVVTLSEADPVKDGFGWVVQGLTDYDAKGAERRKYLAWSYDATAQTYDLSVPSPARYGQQRYDAFGRAIFTYGLDGHITLQTRYRSLGIDVWDGEDIGPGPHAGTYASEQRDGHGRVVRTTERVRLPSGIEARHVDTAYAITGEPVRITRRRGSEMVERTMAYDSIGRMVSNTMPEVGTWHYVYNDAGDLLGTSDARKCGVNFAYDAAGRLLSEDYSPCEPHHAPYGAAPEVTYEYDDAALDAGEAFTSPTDPHMLGEQDCRTTNYTRGRLVAVTDRAQRSLTCYDGRGRTVEVAKRLANPGGVIDGRWYNRRATYDGADRPVTDSTGATTNQPSTVTTTYTLRGAVDQVLSSYGLLVDHVKRDADGLVTEIQYGDAASTTTAFTYDDLRRLRNLTTYRASLDGWVHGPGTQQMLLQDEQFSYDRVGNPLEIRDWRDPAEWPVGAKPVTRKMQYDSLYRLSRMDYQYSAGDDDWVDPYGAETEDPSRPQPSPRADFAGGKRVQWQSYRYDWLGNTEATDDDAHAFYDRSLGTVTNDGYKLQGADIDAGDRQGELGTVYDAAGNLVQLDVDRHGDVVGGAHWPPSVHGQERLVQRYAYEWDEVGRLVRARRWDMQNPTTIPPDDADVDAELSFTYDASDQRVRKTSGAQHTLYVFASLELRGAQYETGDYSQAEVPYLFANGVRLARVVHGDSTGVYLELGDHLGSTSVVLDRATGELVQRDTAYAYGAVESSYRSEKFEEFREDYRFTGKEDDVEVGLIYFGKRYYAPLLGRWISPDPLAVHAPGQADLNLYAYVHGKVLVAVDPVGLSPAIPVVLVGAELAEFLLAGTVLGTSVAASTKADHDIDRRRAEHLGRALVHQPGRAQPAIQSSMSDAGRALEQRVRSGSAQRAANRNEVEKSSPADPNGGGSDPGKKPEPKKAEPRRTQDGPSAKPPSRATPEPAPQPSAPTAGHASAQSGSAGEQGMVYRGGSRTDDNLTPRPGRDTQGEKRGLSTWDSLDKAARPGEKAQVIDPSKLSRLETHRQADGHVSIRPATQAELDAWAATRGSGQGHPSTDEVRGAIVGEVRRPQ
jgi:RHS repeat-associated protein